MSSIKVVKGQLQMNTVRKFQNFFFSSEIKECVSFSASADTLPVYAVRDINASNNVEGCSRADASNHSPQQYGGWSYVFLIKGENIPSATLNRPYQGVMVNEKEQSYLLRILFD